MIAVKRNIVIEQGVTYQSSFIRMSSNRVPVNMVGYSARMQVRETFGSPILIELTTENGMIVIDGLIGKISIEIPSAKTSLLKFKNALYDLVLIDSLSKKTRLFSGQVIFSPAITL